jgi:tetratricopeptide (TPR) repeat protein
MDDFNKAEKYLLKAIEISPGWIYPYNNLALVYTYKMDSANADKYFKKSLDLNPNFSSTFLGLSKLYYNTSNYKKAEELIEKALKFTDNNNYKAYLFSSCFCLCSIRRCI